MVEGRKEAARLIRSVRNSAAIVTLFSRSLFHQIIARGYVFSDTGSLNASERPWPSTRGHADDRSASAPLAARARGCRGYLGLGVSTLNKLRAYRRGSPLLSASARPGGCLRYRRPQRVRDRAEGPQHVRAPYEPPETHNAPRLLSGHRQSLTTEAVACQAKWHLLCTPPSGFGPHLRTKSCTRTLRSSSTGSPIPIEHTLRGRSAGRGSKRRPVGAVEKEREVAPVEYAAAWLAQHYQVPTALAETIAMLAGSGGVRHERRDRASVTGGSRLVQAPPRPGVSAPAGAKRRVSGGHFPAGAVQLALVKQVRPGSRLRLALWATRPLCDCQDCLGQIWHRAAPAEVRALAVEVAAIVMGGAR